MSSPDWPVTLRIWNKVLPTMTKRKTPSKMGPILLSYCFFYFTLHNYLFSQRLVDTFVVVALAFKSHLLVVRHFIFFYLLLFDDLRILRVSDNFLLFLILPFWIICFFMLTESLFWIFYLFELFYKWLIEVNFEAKFTLFFIIGITENSDGFAFAWFELTDFPENHYSIIIWLY